MFEMTDEEKKVGRKPCLTLLNSTSFSKLLDESSFIQESPSVKHSKPQTSIRLCAHRMSFIFRPESVLHSLILPKPAASQVLVSSLPRRRR